MVELTQSDNVIIVKPNSAFRLVGIFALFMAAVGIYLIFGLLPLEENYTVADIVGVVFIVAWVLVVLSMGIYAFVTNSKQLMITDEGIFCDSWFSKDFIKWSDVKDWGLSYCGQTRGEGNTYYLYFSKREHPIKNDCKKSLKGKMIKTFIFDREYADIVTTVIPFCTDRTEVKPFVGEDKFHFI